MIFKKYPRTTKENVVSKPLETSPSIPKVIKPITTISSKKSKKGNTTKPSIKTKKSKRSESKIALSMTDLYKKENPFISTIFEPSVGTSVKDLKDADVEENPKIVTDVATSADEKGNLDETLTVEVSESSKNLGLEDLNVAIESTENIDHDDSKTSDESTGKDTDQLSPEKADDQNDVVLDVGISLDQREKQHDDVASPDKDESAHKNESEKERVYGDTTMNSPSQEEKQTGAEQTDVETDPEEDVSVEKYEENVVDVDDMDSDDIPLGRKYSGSVAKRLRSSKGKAVPSEVETSKTRTKSVGIGPKKGWSKVKIKSTAGRTKKKKIASTSESEYDVEEDALNITSSIKKKSAGKKNVQTVENIPIDKVSFHLPENAQRWKFILLEQKMFHKSPIEF